MDMYFPPQPGVKGTAELVVTLSASVMSPLPKQRRFLIKGSQGSYVKYGPAANGPQVTHLDPVQVDLRGIEPQENWGDLIEARPGTGPGLDNAEYTVTKWVVNTVGGGNGADPGTHRYETASGDWAELYRNLAEAIGAGDRTRLAVKPEEAVEVLRLIELAQRSSRERRVVDVE